MLKEGRRGPDGAREEFAELEEVEELSLRRTGFLIC